MAYQALKNRADAEDVMQTALLRLLESDTAFESEAHMRNWLIHVAVNESRKILRGAWRRHTFSLNEDWDAPAFDNTSQRELFDAVMVSLCVCAGAANAATDGALAQAIKLHIAQAFQINDYKDAMETEEGTTIVTYGADVRLTQENGRVLLHIDQEALDITDTLERDGAYTYEDTDGDTTLRVAVTPDEEHPGEWGYSVSYLDPALKEGGEVSYSSNGSSYHSNEGSTAEKPAASVPAELR